MKRLILLGILLAGSAASAQTFTAAADGDWQSATTWGTTPGLGCHSTYPCMTDTYSGGPTNGDTIDLNGKTVTCSTGETCSFGNSPSSAITACTIVGNASMINNVASGGLVVQTGATFVVAGHGCLLKNTRTFQAGSTIYVDSSWATTPTAITFMDNPGSGSGVTGSWLFGSSLSGARITIDGDAYDSPLACRLTGAGCNTHCATPGAAGCIGGQWGGSISVAPSGTVTAYNVTVKNLGGTGNWWGFRLGSADALMAGMEIYNSGAITTRQDGAGSYTLENSYITASSSSTCLTIQKPGSTGVFITQDDVLECYVPVTAVTAITQVQHYNTIFRAPWSAGSKYTAGTSNLYPGLNPSAYFAKEDQNLHFSDGWNTTASENANTRAGVSSTLTNSIIWAPRMTHTGTHVHSLTGAWGLNGNFVYANNVGGSYGWPLTTPGAESGQNGFPIGGSQPSSPSTSSFDIFGCVTTCSAWGLGSMSPIGGFFSSTTIAVTTSYLPADSVQYHNNTNCASLAALNTTNYADGYHQWEQGTYPDHMIDSQANMYYRTDGVGTGVVVEVASPGSAPPGNPIWNYMQGNAVINTTTGAAGSAPCGTNNTTCNWATNPPSTSTEVILPAVQPALVDPYRAFPLFSEYLDKSGLYPVANYASPHVIDLGVTTVTTNYLGAWTSSTVYAPGDLVYVDSSVSGYSNVYNGRRTYWVCKIGHTAGATNAPIIGDDASNPFMGPTPYWESAFMPLWVKPNVIAGTRYGNGSCTDPNHCDDGALPPVYGSNPVSAIGLINQWIRQGMISMIPQAWGGVQGTSQCQRAGVATECGAVPLSMVRHMSVW